MQAALEKARAEVDAAKRIEEYKQVQDLIADEVPIIPLFWEPEFITYRNGVEGVTIGAPFEFNYNVLSFAADYTLPLATRTRSSSVQLMLSTAWIHRMHIPHMTGNC